MDVPHRGHASVGLVLPAGVRSLALQDGHVTEMDEAVDIGGFPGNEGSVDQVAQERVDDLILSYAVAPCPSCLLVLRLSSRP